MKAIIALALAGLSLVPSTSVSAQTKAKLYSLKVGSTFDYGCYGPCVCPVISQPMQGTFQLRPSSVDPQFTNYEVQRVRWTLPDATKKTTITGSWIYRIGGEFAVQQQMVLNLSVGGGPVQRFDSGLVSGGGTFPDIDIKVSLHGQQACTDTVLHIIASPSSTSPGTFGSFIGPSTRGVRSVDSGRGASILLSVPQSDRVDVSIFDVQGRAIRHLVAGQWMPAGEHAL